MKFKLATPIQFSVLGNEISFHVLIKKAGVVMSDVLPFTFNKTKMTKDLMKKTFTFFLNKYEKQNSELISRCIWWPIICDYGKQNVVFNIGYEKVCFYEIEEKRKSDLFLMSCFVICLCCLLLNETDIGKKTLSEIVLLSWLEYEKKTPKNLEA